MWKWTTAAFLFCLAAPLASRGEEPSTRILEVSFRPTGRAQLALWVERADGTFLETLRLTQSVSLRGIGNRPGALQMNSGFRWPYGRREGVLPVWGHRRAAAPDAELFPRVIFQDRTYEGWASRSSNDASRDDYFCLSFDVGKSRRDALDAVSCASVFNSDKGRYLGEADVAGNYAEPWEDAPMAGRMRELTLGSIYPPRRDVTRCAESGCADHLDVTAFDDDARQVMPEIDAVTMATPAANADQGIQFSVPPEWADGGYVLALEINVEGDYNDVFSEENFPTPTAPEATWDYWAINYGYPYRGQPSVVYRVSFTLSSAGGTFSTDLPAGTGSLQGETGDIRPLDASVTDDPDARPGSGADRLRQDTDGSRLRVTVIPTNVCEGESPPPECGSPCSDTNPCASGFLCSEGACTGLCQVEARPDPVGNLFLEPYPDEKHSHQWARLHFTVPRSLREISRYEVRFGTDGISDESSFERAQPAFAADIDTIELAVPTDGDPNEEVVVDIGGMLPQISYAVGVRAVDQCNVEGPIEVAAVETTPIHFTTVSPCFVATATYGSPLANEVEALRVFRDRHLMTHWHGRVLVAGYYAIGPFFASAIRDSPVLRSLARIELAPWVAFARWLEEKVHS